jgi:pSer/pThr/pTyr-binding forkhead associated (FHA) protein
MPPNTRASSMSRVTASRLLADGDARPLRRAETIVGRGADAHVQIEGPGMSRRHAKIRLTAGGALVEDLGSKNGTFVRGERLTSPRQIADGDEIRFGSVRATFTLPRPDESTETVGR